MTLKHHFFRMMVFREFIHEEIRRLQTFLEESDFELEGKTSDILSLSINLQIKVLYRFRMN